MIYCDLILLRYVLLFIKIDFKNVAFGKLNMNMILQIFIIIIVK